MAVNVEHRSYAGLSRALEYDQAAPIGFLYLEKTLVGLLGDNEFSFRLLPLICSIASIAVFLFVCRRFFDGWYLIAALTLFCLAPALVAFSAVFKQYSTEVLVAVAILSLSFPLFDKDSPSRVFWLRCVLVASLLWFSFSAVFVLAGVWVTLAVCQAAGTRAHALNRTAGSAILWLIVFAPVYLYSIGPGSANQWLHDYWRLDYFPLHSFGSAPAWLYQRILDVSTMSLNRRFWPLVVLFTICSLVGSVAHRKWPLIAVSCGILACFGAAVVQKYPFADRMILFLIPSFILLTVAGYQSLRSMLPKLGSIPRTLDLVTALALSWCCFSMVKASVSRLDTNHFQDSQAFGQVERAGGGPREGLHFARNNWQEGDLLWATWGVTPCVRYYQDALGWKDAQLKLNVIAEKDDEGHSALFEVGGTTSAALDAYDRHTIKQPSMPFADGRVWLFYTHALFRQHDDSVREYFESRGRQLEHADAVEGSVTLFDVQKR